MPFKEVKELRIAGKLNEALEMAEQDLKADSTNIWNKRAIAWVYYDFLKLNVTPNSLVAFKENLVKLKELQLPADEKMVFDNCAWQIGSMVFGLQKEENIRYGEINEIFDITKEFHFTKPSESYTFIYTAFHKGYQNWSRYLEFADWWNFENFLPENYLKEEYQGRKIMSIAERAYIVYSKKLLEGEAIDQYGQQRIIDKEKVQSFLPDLETIIEKYPDYQYPPYFKAKLLLELGSNENALSAFLPFAKQKRNDFWVWELMAEIFSEDKEIQFACYSKALSLKTSEDFLVKLRQSFASSLVEKKLFNEAKTEIVKLLATRSNNEWKTPPQVTQWMEQDWYKSASEKENNNEIYKQYLIIAEDLLYQDIPEEIIAVEFVNENKSMLNFVKNKNKHGFFKYSNHIEKPQIGDLFKVRFNGEGKDSFFKILTAKKIDASVESEAIKKFKGIIRIVATQDFGFVDDVFIDPSLIKKNNLLNNQLVKGIAILSYNKRKEQWGWKGVKLI